LNRRYILFHVVIKEDFEINRIQERLGRLFKREKVSGVIHSDNGDGLHKDILYEVGVLKVAIDRRGICFFEPNNMGDRWRNIETWFR